jgi:hypothetical protein
VVTFGNWLTRIKTREIASPFHCDIRGRARESLEIVRTREKGLFF